MNTFFNPVYELMANITVIVNKMIERITIFSPFKPVSLSIPADIKGTPKASDVAAPPNNPKINKISTSLPTNLSVCPFNIGLHAWLILYIGCF